MQPVPRQRLRLLKKWNIFCQKEKACFPREGASTLRQKEKGRSAIIHRQSLPIRTGKVAAAVSLLYLVAQKMTGYGL